MRPVHFRNYFICFLAAFTLCFLPGSGIFPATVIRLAREHMSAEEMKRLTDTVDHILIHKGYADNTRSYKALMLKKPYDLVVIGTSRVLQFRQDYFGAARFYNGGQLIGNPGHLKQILSEFRSGELPETLILGLDQNFFNSKWSRANKSFDAFETMSTDCSVMEIVLKQWRQILSDWFEGKFSLRELVRRSADEGWVGIGAALRKNGLRKDGSFRYGDSPELQKHPQARMAETLDRVAQGIARFEFGNNIAGDMVEELAAALRWCHSRGISVIGFLPPYAPSVYRKMVAAGKHGYLFKLPAALRPVFAEFQFEFYDFTNALDLPAADEEFIDGFHGSERVYAKLLRRMLESGSRLNRYSDLTALEAMIAKAVLPFSIVEDRL